MSGWIFTGRRRGEVAVRLPAGLRPQLDEMFASLDTLMTTDEPRPDADPLEALTGMTGSSEERPAPEDPALARLRPDGYAADVDDGAAAAEYRRLMGGDLEALQRARVAEVRETLTQGDSFTLAPATAQAWLGALNDLRLVLGARLEITDDETAWPGADDPRAAGFELYGLLLAIQSDLLVALGAPKDL